MSIQYKRHTCTEKKKKKSVQCYTVRTDLDKELFNPPTDVQNITIFWTFSPHCTYV